MDLWPVPVILSMSVMDTMLIIMLRKSKSKSKKEKGKIRVIRKCLLIPI